MSFAYQPFYTGDYYRDTRHLSMLQHGAYRQLLDHCWDQRGPLPLDVDKCYRICGAVSKEEQDAVRSIIFEFFVEMTDGHYNRRMQKEIERCHAISAVRSDIGRKGGLAKAKQLPSKRQAKAKQMPLSPSPSPSPTQDQTNEIPITPDVVVGTRGTRLPKDWAIPDDWAVWAKTERPDLDPAKTAEAFADYWHAKAGKDASKADWKATWRNWVRNQKKTPVERSRALGEPSWVEERDRRVAAFAGRYAESRKSTVNMGDVIDVTPNQLD
jgi:uncharacterized protein YdaU (DUF1376 family)